MSDGKALFHTDHGNLGDDGASTPAAWAAARLAMRKQTELNTGERLGGAGGAEVPAGAAGPGGDGAADAGERGAAGHGQQQRERPRRRATGTTRAWRRRGGG